ncbi:MAG TPA: hypothetical protein VF062_21050 [Candidatus Limnocylindrales bacterium]
MASEEKSAWITIVVSVCAYAAYAVIVLGRAGATPLAEVPYASTMLWSIGGGIIASIVLYILVSILSFEKPEPKDQRDREIGRIGDHIGQSFAVIGSVVALLLALAEFPYFWIANAIYLGFVLSAVLGSVAKIFAYRRGYQTW